MTAADAPLILVSHAVLTPLVPALEAQGWRVAFADALSPAEQGEVRAVLHAGLLPLPMGILQALPKPGLLACLSAGYDGVDVAWCRANGIEVTHAQGVNAEEVADLAVGLVLAAWRNIVAGDRAVREDRWPPPRLVGGMPLGLGGRQVGIVGLGHIGQAVARRLEAFGTTIAWWGPRPKPVRWPRAESLLALARQSDILVVTSRSEPANLGMISAAVIDAVGPEGLIVNVARGALVDEDALIAALKAGRLGRAALDVFAEEPTPAARWANVPGVVLTPHIGGATTDGMAKLVAQAVSNIRRHLAGQPLISPVAE